MSVDYDALWRSPWLLVQSVGPLTRSRYRLVLRALRAGLPPGARVLDVGCGNGTLLGHLARSRPDLALHGVEQSAEAVDRAPPGIRDAIVRGDLDSALREFERTPVDVLVCSEVLEHLVDPEEALRLMRLAMKPGALAVFTVPARMAWWSSQDDFAGHVQRFEHDRFGAMLSAAGFRVLRQYGWGVGPALLYDRATSLMGPQRAIRVGGSRAGRWLAAVLYSIFLVEDLMPCRLGFQLVAVARAE